jgi:hypothetical protein
MILWRQSFPNSDVTNPVNKFLSVILRRAFLFHNFLVMRVSHSIIIIIIIIIIGHLDFDTAR